MLHPTLLCPDPRPELVEAARQFHRQGWMVGTAGNLSARLPDGSFWITASGCDKGTLDLGCFVRLTATGEVLERPHPDVRPSAETCIHQTLYGLFPEARACYHVHSIEANLACHFTQDSPGGKILPLPPLEMLKGLGIWQEEPQVSIPLFPNYLDVPRIAAAIRDRIQAQPPEVPALLICDHGVTVWAPSTTRARHYLELVEYLFRYLLASHQLNLKTINH